MLRRKTVSVYNISLQPLKVWFRFCQACDTRIATDNAQVTFPSVLVLHFGRSRVSDLQKHRVVLYYQGRQKMQYAFKNTRQCEMYHAKATGCSTYELCAIVVLMRIHNDCILVCHNNFPFSFNMDSMQTRGTVRSIKLLHAEVQ